MTIPFCKSCGCVADDTGYCGECEPVEEAAEPNALDSLVARSGEFSVVEIETAISMLEAIVENKRRKKEEMDCAFPCNGVCRSCRKPVVWVTMLPSKKSTPINPVLEEGGNVEIRPNKAGRLYAKVTGPDPEQKKFISHFATCPQAKDWRGSMIKEAIDNLS